MHGRPFALAPRVRVSASTGVAPAATAAPVREATLALDDRPCGVPLRLHRLPQRRADAAVSRARRERWFSSGTAARTTPADYFCIGLAQRKQATLEPSRAHSKTARPTDRGSLSFWPRSWVDRCPARRGRPRQAAVILSADRAEQRGQRPVFLKYRAASLPTIWTRLPRPIWPSTKCSPVSGLGTACMVGAPLMAWI